jgi:transcriptional regulator with XRE-family HTH domain
MMLSPTLRTGLNGYGLGGKIRTLRLKKKMGLVELGRHTGLSPALLSKIERGRLFPTLPTLLRIALVFSVGLEFFFVGSREKPLVEVVRKAERVRLPERPGARQVSYRFESLDYPATERRFNSYFAEFLPARATSYGRIRIPVWSSFTRWRVPSVCTLAAANTPSRRATPCISTRQSLTRTDAAPAVSALPSS